jgi:hypothetical protein
MKVLLRNKRTGEFFAASGVWVHSAQQARDFGYSDIAEEFCERLGTSDVGVFYVFNRSQMASCAASRVLV